jgi:MFS family permease
MADSVGRATVICAGYAALMAIYLVLLSAVPAVVMIGATVILLGTFYAATDGVFAALASAELPVERRATGLAIVSAGNDVGRLIASVIFGWLWSRGAIRGAVVPFQFALPVVMLITMFLLKPWLMAPRHD